MVVVRCVLSGSFRRSTEELEREYQELALAGCQILSPHRLDFVDVNTDFVKDAAEETLSVQEIEQHHLLALRQADFVWLHCPAGYVGPSAAFELGYALAHGKPVFGKTVPEEEVFRSYVQAVPSVFMVLQKLGLL